MQCSPHAGPPPSLLQDTPIRPWTEEEEEELKQVVLRDGVGCWEAKARAFSTERRSVLGYWVGARHLFSPLLIPHRVPHGLTPRS